VSDISTMHIDLSGQTEEGSDMLWVYQCRCVGDKYHVSSQDWQTHYTGYFWDSLDFVFDQSVSTDNCVVLEFITSASGGGKGWTCTYTTDLEYDSETVYLTDPAGDFASDSHWITGADLSGIQCSYTSTQGSYDVSTTYLTTLSQTFANTRYAPTTKDTWVINPEEDIASVTLSVSGSVSKTDTVEVYVAHCDGSQSTPDLDTADLLYTGHGKFFAKELSVLFDPSAVTTVAVSANCVVVQMTTDGGDMVGTGFSCTYTASPFVSADTLVALPTLTEGQTGTLSPESPYNGQDSLWYYLDENMYYGTIKCQGELGGDIKSGIADHLVVGQAVCATDGTITHKTERNHQQGPSDSVNLITDIATARHEGFNCWYVRYTTNTLHMGSGGISCQYTVDDYDTWTEYMVETQASFANRRYMSYQYDEWVVYPGGMVSADLVCKGTLGEDDYVTVHSAVCTGHKDGSITTSGGDANAQQSGRIRISETLDFDPSFTTHNCFIVALETFRVEDVGSRSISCTYTATLAATQGMPWYGVALIALGVLVLLGGGGYFLLWPRYGHKLTGKLDLEAGQEDLPIMSGIDAKEAGEGAYGSGVAEGPETV
ncbi:hypothetical protein KIPB_003811, partial [Kipferlia bialata]